MQLQSSSSGCSSSLSHYAVHNAYWSLGKRTQMCLGRREGLTPQTVQFSVDGCVIKHTSLFLLAPFTTNPWCNSSSATSSHTLFSNSLTSYIFSYFQRAQGGFSFLSLISLGNDPDSRLKNLFYGIANEIARLWHLGSCKVPIWFMCHCHHSACTE